MRGGKKVLVIDDSASVRQQISHALVEAGFEVIEAIDGLDGVAKIEAHPDLAMVLCDVNMPRMSGLELVETLLVDDKYAQLPIVMLTTEGHPSLIQRARQAGAKGWIIKPFKPALLVATVRKLAAAT
jgi:two-component system, chemotaxis family, chemotaxis protein CheY